MVRENCVSVHNRIFILFFLFYRLRPYCSKNISGQSDHHILRHCRHTSNVALLVKHWRHHGHLFPIHVLASLLLHLYSRGSAEICIQEASSTLPRTANVSTYDQASQRCGAVSCVNKKQGITKVNFNLYSIAKGKQNIV